MRRLSVSMFATVGNYDYGFYWHFYQDGSIHCDVKLTGIMNTAAVTQTPHCLQRLIVGRTSRVNR